jgi:hypothetical protein
MHHLVISYYYISANVKFYAPQNYGAFYDTVGAGITGPVTLKFPKNGSTTDLSSQQWTYQVSLGAISFFGFIEVINYNTWLYFRECRLAFKVKI